jgi:hypothetical protein
MLWDLNAVEDPIPMRRTLALSIATALVLGASSASARRVSPGNEFSWGKAGVSLEDYWVDSSQCGHQAAAVDLTGTAPAKALVLASRRLDVWTDFESVQDALRLAAPEVQWGRAATIIRQELEKCLMEHGYVKFRLTKSQAHHLKKLEVGTLDRRKYLHSLASDPAVLEAQALRSS